MNRILFTPDEIRADGTAAFGGTRAEHVLGVLHGEVGQVLKTGVVNGPIGTSTILAIGDRTPKDGDRPLDSNGLSPWITVQTQHEAEGLSPWVDLILAPPRPRVFKRLLPQLAALGVGRIVLVGAKKVEKDFWGATLLKKENYTPLLIDGLMQAGTSALPTLETRRNFRRFVTDELDALFPTPHRIVAHPYDDGDRPLRNNGDSPSADGDTPRANGDSPRLLLAVGPEGGWTDEEVKLLEEHGFSRYSLGKRILRTDTAAVALLAKLNVDNR